MIREAEPGDRPLIERLITANAKVLGKMNPGTLFYRYEHGGNPREHILVAPGIGFVHYLERKDGVKTVYEIAVDAEHKRQGWARRLLDAVGRPITLKTDADSEESNAAYRAMGFRALGRVQSKSGKKLIVYGIW